MHWGSPENLSDVTHPFLNFSLSSPGSLSEYCTTHGFLMVLASGDANRQDSVSFCRSKGDFIPLYMPLDPVTQDNPQTLL